MYFRAGTEHQNNRKNSLQPAISSVGSRDVFHLIIEASGDWGPFLNSSVLHKIHFFFFQKLSILDWKKKKGKIGKEKSSH